MGNPRQIEITLYVRGQEPATVRAREALQAVVAGLPLEAVVLRVFDLDDEASAHQASEDGVYTAPLIRLRLLEGDGSGPASWVAHVTADNVRDRVEQLLEPDAAGRSTPVS